MDSTTTPHRQRQRAPRLLSRTLAHDGLYSELDGFATDPYMRSENSETPKIKTDPTKEPKPHGHGQKNRKRKSASSSTDLVENKENNGGSLLSPKSSKISHETCQKSLADALAQVKQLREENERLEEEGRKLREENSANRQFKESEVLTEFLQIANNSGKDNLLEKDAVFGREGEVVSNANPDFVFTGPTHPLEIDLILMNVMKFLKPIELQKCRLVSKNFHHFASKELLKSHTPVLISNSKNARLFTKVMQNSSGFPYSKIILKDKCGVRTRSYLNSFGSHIKKLKLDLNNVYCRDVINFENVTNILSSMPQLEELELFELHYPDIGPEGLLEIQPLSPLPCLTRLKINYEERLNLGPYDNSSFSLFSRFLSSCTSLTSLSAHFSSVNEGLLSTLSSLPSLRELEFKVVDDMRHGGVKMDLSLLGASASLRLRKLRLELLKWDSEGLGSLLTSQAQTLEELDIIVKEYSREPVMFMFPKFHKLRILQLTERNSKNVIPISRTPNPEFPQLVTLALTDSFFKPFTSSPTPSLSKLVIHQLHLYSNLLKYYILRDLRVIFPNLISLHLHDPEERIIEATLASCHFLQELIIEMSAKPYRDQADFNIERALTGMTDSGWLRRELKNLDSKNKIIQFSVIEFLRQAGYANRDNGARLTNLTNLKRLQIINNVPLYEPFKVGDLTGYLSLLAIHKLDYLYIREGKLTDSCIRALKSYHNVVVIDTISPPAN